ncbi:acetyl-CoA hydrolase/transferase family protein [Rhodovibrionaceae bacterium A322]
MIRIVEAETLNLANHIRPGDSLIWGQGSGEPLALVEALVAQRQEIGQVRAFVGLSLSQSLLPEHCDSISPFSYGALGTCGALRKAGKLDLLPCHYSSVPNLIAQGQLPIDVVFVQISPPGPDGSHSLGFCNDVLPEAMKKARVVIAEINERVPWSHQDVRLDESLIDFAIWSDRDLPPVRVPKPGPVDQAIAGHIAARISDGDTLQYGVGAIPAAILKALSGHRDLGVHSGLLTEEIIDLIESGVVTNAQKGIHAGKSIGAVCVGGERLSRFMHNNPDIELHQIRSTHGAATLSQLDNLIAINSALEVDLFGQINAEQVGNRYLGAIGGQVDFMHAATTASQGLSIIALPASQGKSGRSRIVSQLSGPFVTTCRADVDLVVTEHGVADLRGKTLDARASSLINIAPPDQREALLRDYHDKLGGGAI